VFVLGIIVVLSLGAWTMCVIAKMADEDMARMEEKKDGET
jgi:hypothetical protein